MIHHILLYMSNSNIIKEYQEFQKDTEVNDNFDIKYMAIGLAGEVGEVLNEIKKIERDDDNIVTPDRKLKLKNELGDVLWYFVGICNRLDYKIDDILKCNQMKIKGKQNISKKINSTFTRDETADLFGNYSQHRGCFS